MLNLQGQWIFGCAALDLRREGLAVDSATDANIVQARMAFNDVVALTHLDDGFAALTAKLVHMHRDVAVVAFGTQHHHAVVMTNLHIVTRQLATQVGGTFT